MCMRAEGHTEEGGTMKKNDDPFTKASLIIEKENMDEYRWFKRVKLASARHSPRTHNAAMILSPADPAAGSLPYLTDRDKNVWTSPPHSSYKERSIPVHVKARLRPQYFKQC